MAKEALPCAICGESLDNVFQDCQNQPSGGISLTSHGNYGSTAFDPDDGQHIEINICDACLISLGERDMVYTGRYKRPALVMPANGSTPVQVGWERIDRPYVHWKQGSQHDEWSSDVCLIESVQEFNRCYDITDAYGRDRFEWHLTASQIQRILVKGLE